MPTIKPILERLFPPRRHRRAAHRLYARLVEQARSPTFYLDYGVPDTLDGRFDLVVLHVHLLLHRLRELPEMHALQTALQEVLFDDLDRSLREMGVGDLSVGKRVKAMARAYFGRLKAYDAALADNRQETVEAALARNVWRGSASAGARIDALASYMRGQCQHLAGQPTAALEVGEVTLLAPERTPQP